MTNLKQKWTCDLCGKSGTIEYEKKEGVWEVSGRIMDDHKIISPDCNGGGNTIRVEAEE